MKLVDSLASTALISCLIQRRFFKFGLVGASGILVNLGALYVAQEYVFRAIVSVSIRLNAALAFAIFCATLSNFFWNRRWTWADRSSIHNRYLIVQFGQYALGSWVGIMLQFLLTQCLATLLHYLAANLLAILFSSTCNFLLHNFWTFKTSAQSVTRTRL